MRQGWRRAPVARQGRVVGQRSGVGGKTRSVVVCLCALVTIRGCQRRNDRPGVAEAAMLPGADLVVNVQCHGTQAQQQASGQDRADARSPSRWPHVP